MSRLRRVSKLAASIPSQPSALASGEFESDCHSNCIQCPQSSQLGRRLLPRFEINEPNGLAPTANGASRAAIYSCC